MMVFADSSALVKLYVAETGTAAMRHLTEDADVLVSFLAFAETIATFTRLFREERLTREAFSEVCADFQADWVSFFRLPLDSGLEPLIMELCQRHSLRGADAVHLASTVMLVREGLELVFACNDQRLVEAARAEGLDVFDPAHHD